MYEMPLTFVSGFVVGKIFFCVGVLGIGVFSLAFCPEILNLLRYIFKTAELVMFGEFD